MLHLPCSIALQTVHFVNRQQFKPRSCQSWHILTLAHRWISFTSPLVMQETPGHVVDRERICFRSNDVIKLTSDLLLDMYCTVTQPARSSCDLWTPLWSLVLLQFLLTLFSSSHLNEIFLIGKRKLIIDNFGCRSTLYFTCNHFKAFERSSNYWRICLKNEKFGAVGSVVV